MPNRLLGVGPRSSVLGSSDALSRRAMDIGSSLMEKLWRRDDRASQSSQHDEHPNSDDDFEEVSDSEDELGTIEHDWQPLCGPDPEQTVACSDSVVFFSDDSDRESEEDEEEELGSPLVEYQGDGGISNTLDSERLSVGMSNTLDSGRFSVAEYKEDEVESDEADPSQSNSQALPSSPSHSHSSLVDSRELSEQLGTSELFPPTHPRESSTWRR